MAVEIDQAEATTGVRVLTAPVIELAFSCYVAEKASVGLGRLSQPWLHEASTEHSDLLQRIGQFWQSQGYYEWGEIVILAQRTGTLFSEVEQFFRRFEQAASEPSIVPELASEEEGVREILQDRLDRLAASPELRKAYLALVREFWAMLEPYWRTTASAAASELAASYRRRLSRTDDIRSVLPRNHFARREAHAGLVQRAVAAGEAVIVPLALGGVGIAFFALPGILIIGVGPEAEKRQDKRREAAERAAARFKVLSDPTRLSILTSFCFSPASISDMASFFDLSQPTVSVHVKLLREAGLLEATKVRGQTLYRSNREKVDELVNAALGELFNS